MKKKLFFLILIINIVSSEVGFSQEKEYSSGPSKNVIEKSSCEINSLGLSDLILNVAREEFIIVISHLANKEKRFFGQRRLHNVETFFTKGSTQSSNNRPFDSFLIAEGKIVKDKGFLDFYVRGKLELRIFFNKNQDLLVPPCVFNPEEKPCLTDYEKLFYPCKK